MIDISHRQNLLEEYIQDLKEYSSLKDPSKDPLLNRLTQEYAFNILANKWGNSLGFYPRDIKSHLSQLESKKIDKIETLEEVLNDNSNGGEWILLDLFTKGALYLLAGAPKVGKSIFTYSLISSFLQGKPFLGRNTKPCKILHYQLEEPPWLRRKRLIRSGVDQDLLSVEQYKNSYYSKRFISLSDGNCLKVLSQTIEEKNIDIVIIDTLRAGTTDSGMTEIDPKMGYILGKIQKIAIETNATIILVHHMRKEVTGDVSIDVAGTNSLFSNSDGAIGLYADGTKIKMLTHPRHGNKLEIKYSIIKRRGITSIQVERDSSMFFRNVSTSILSLFSDTSKQITEKDLSSLERKYSTDQIENALEYLIDVSILDYKNETYTLNRENSWMLNKLEENENLDKIYQKILQCKNYSEVLSVIDSSGIDKDVLRENIPKKISDYVITLKRKKRR
ncbi:MAG: hypothetical protein CV045_11740 [Cyanobacteria bacterium M5B4]|nr:MAG: hypothetical protein CV045_11740 [Cyanobacteria bacterium M5B4]